MQTVQIDAFKLIGISVRTSNANGQSAKDIGELWNTFMSENILQKIPNRIDDAVYSVYTNYEGDHTKPYDTILACKVSTLDEIPEGMVGQAFDSGSYVKVVSKGDLREGLVYNAWLDIWKMDINRNYRADFEVYGPKAQNPKDAEVEIYVGVKS